MAEVNPTIGDQPGIRRLYDLMGASYDWFSFYEARAKRRALQLFAPAPGQQLLNVGCGTGKEHRALMRGVNPGGQAYGLEASRNMAALAHRRTETPLLQGDAAWLPYAAECFDGVFCTYVLDLLPAEDLPVTVQGFRRVLKPGGRLALLSLTEGCNISSRAFVGLWKLAYRLSPLACGGCRPLQLADLVMASGFQIIERQVIVQLGVPSELILAEKITLPVSV
jgi:ubiquinone/menaquinone biosynthesis C-methylase UbiE